ncbi:hypothetical protein GGS20DRAFT_557193 [Poronia punctata]|nr:hypothetical protein GGS20DRAFT_557193 [Poronia punctata]
MVQRDDIRDTDLSLRFKIGNQTIFLFVDPLESFLQTQHDLLDILKEVYPDGIPISATNTKKMSIPEAASHIKLAVPKNPLDLNQGWKPLSLRPEDSATSLGIKDNAIVAFVGSNNEELDSADFYVDVPSFDDDDDDDVGSSGDS